MKSILILAFITVSALPLGAKDGTSVLGPTFEGVIFSVHMLPKPTHCNPQPALATDWPPQATYWTPSAELVRKAEKDFADAVYHAQSKVPPGGPHAPAYYNPKNSGRDQDSKLPADIYTNGLYNVEPGDLTPRVKRQYIGVTSAGKKWLLINYVYSENYTNEDRHDTFMDWHRQWLVDSDSGQVFYDIKTGGFKFVGY